MSIKVIRGDMVAHLTSEKHFDAYAHQCNCFSRMGRGIAPQLAKVVPGLRDADSKNTGSRSKMGTFTKATHPNGSIVYNIYGQFHWSNFQVEPGRNTDYEALRKGLVAVMEDLHRIQYEEDITRNMTLGLPFIGCGLAGGDWHDVVYPMIEDIFEDSGVNVVIFKF